MFIRAFQKRRFCKVKAAVLPSKSGSFAKRKRRFCFIKEYILHFRPTIFSSYFFFGTVFVY
ncbi:hypothetical protein CUC04_02460 [Prevotella intermedia]|uniref:Uncharacterized protein n=1 Tax=Prevotella intermedia TaxID=28131 RepID=A0A2G9IF31_PREIN|nr:hypothetical protein CUC04_02460 [Prevotella intermedia]